MVGAEIFRSAGRRSVVINILPFHKPGYSRLYTSYRQSRKATCESLITFVRYILNVLRNKERQLAFQTTRSTRKKRTSSQNMMKKREGVKLVYEEIAPQMKRDCFDYWDKWDVASTENEQNTNKKNRKLSLEDT